MSKVELTVRQIKNLGLWAEVCDYKGWNPYMLNEGRISEDEIVEFDDKFEKKVDNQNTYSTPEEKVKELYDSYYGQGDFGHHVTNAIKTTLDAFNIKVDGINS